MEELSVCPVCDSTQLKPLFYCQDYTVSQEKFQLVQCQRCQFILTSPRPIVHEISKYYQSDAYISHSTATKSLIGTAYRTVQQMTLRRKLKLINQLSPHKGQLLDNGCGVGAFLKTCQQDNWQITGIEPDAKAAELAYKETKAVVHTKLYDLPASNQMDIVTMWHVLEHVYDLHAHIGYLKKLLKPSGTLVVAVPNPASADAQYFKEYWAAYDVPRHIWHFNSKNIGQLFARHQMKVVRVLPMYFDAYYISLLSTKYQSGKTNLWKGVWQGFRSNQKAKGSGQYSSLIYILQNEI